MKNDSKFWVFFSLKFNLQHYSRFSYRQKVLRCIRFHVVVQHAKVLKMSINQTILHRKSAIFSWECVERNDRWRCREIKQQIFDGKRSSELLHLISILILVLKKGKKKKKIIKKKLPSEIRSSCDIIFFSALKLSQKISMKINQSFPFSLVSEKKVFFIEIKPLEEFGKFVFRSPRALSNTKAFAQKLPPQAF